jgi:hypothetical protein
MTPTPRRANGLTYGRSRKFGQPPTTMRAGQPSARIIASPWRRDRDGIPPQASPSHAEPHRPRCRIRCNRSLRPRRHHVAGFRIHTPKQKHNRTVALRTRTTRLVAGGGRLHRTGDPRAGPRDADVTGRTTASIGHLTALRVGTPTAGPQALRPCAGTIAYTTSASSCRLCLCHEWDRLTRRDERSRSCRARISAPTGQDDFGAPRRGNAGQTPRADEALFEPAGRSKQPGVRDTRPRA